MSPVIVTASLVLASCLAYLVADISGDAGVQPVSSLDTAKQEAVSSLGDDRQHQKRIEAGSRDASPAEPIHHDSVLTAVPRVSQITGKRPVDGLQPGHGGSAFLSEQSSEKTFTQSQNTADRMARHAARVFSTTGSAIDATPLSGTGATASVADGAGSYLAPEGEREADSGESASQHVNHQTEGAYTAAGSELVAEVRVDIDEVQRIRCYPVSRQDSTPCMCEFTIIKEGRTQTDLIDNCQ